MSESRIDAFLAVLTDPSAPDLPGDHQDDPLLLALVCHVFHEDGSLAPEELDLLVRLTPKWTPERLTQFCDDVRVNKPDLSAVVKLGETPSTARSLLRLVRQAGLSELRLDEDEGEVLPALRRALYPD